MADIRNSVNLTTQSVTRKETQLSDNSIMAVTFRELTLFHILLVAQKQTSEEFLLDCCANH